MAYIGKTPVIGNFVKLDSITVVNGQAAYTMQNGGVNFTSYDNVNQFLVSLNGVLQAPTDSFTVSGSTLTFASNLSTGDVIDFVLVLGNSLDIGTPSDNTISTAKLQDNAITSAKLASGVIQNQSAFKNIIINGDMSIDQRNSGSSVTVGTVNPLYTLDRMPVQSSQSSKFSIQQNAGSVTPPTYFKNYIGATSLSAYTIASGDYFTIRQGIEGSNIINLAWGTSDAKTVTLSFWVRSSLTGTFGGSFTNSAFNRSYPFSYTITSANTWEKKSITVAGDTSGTWLTTNGVGIYVTFGLGVGSTYSGTAGAWSASGLLSATGATSVVGTNAATFYMTGLQLEAGTTASDFEFLPYDVNLQRCQRYYETFSQGCNGTAYSTGAISFAITYKTTKRATPSGTLLDTSINVNRAGVGSYTSSSSSIAGASYKTSGALLNIDGWSGLTSTIAMYPPYSQDDWIAFSSEL